MKEIFELSDAEIDSIGVMIMKEQLEHDGWKVKEVTSPDGGSVRFQLVAEKSGELAFFLVRTALSPERGKFNGGSNEYEQLVRHAKSRGAECYFASLGIEPVEATPVTNENIRGQRASFDVKFDGLIRMELPGETIEA